MRNFQDTLETRKRSFISTLSICMAVPLGVSSMACKCAFYRPEQNTNGGRHEIEF